MAIIPFSVFLDKIQDGRKCRTYRRAKCIYERKTGRCSHIGIGSMCSHDYINCPGYEYRIKPGSTIHAYTGLMQRLYCKKSNEGNQDVKDGRRCPFEPRRCSKNCIDRGALLLRPDLPRCIDTYPIKLKYITEEDARLDGFESIGKGTNGLTKEFANSLEKAFRVRPLEQLKQFLITNYNAKPDTPIQAIIWEELKGRNAGK